MSRIHTRVASVSRTEFRMRIRDMRARMDGQSQTGGCGRLSAFAAGIPKSPVYLLARTYVYRLNRRLPSSDPDQINLRSPDTDNFKMKSSFRIGYLFAPSF